MQRAEDGATMNTAERTKVEAVVERIVTAGCRGETMAEVAHDARNMVTALSLYCDLLEEPGVLASPFAHYGSELRMVAAASRRLVDKLSSMDGGRSNIGRDNLIDPCIDSRMDMGPEAPRVKNGFDRRRPAGSGASRWGVCPSSGAVFQTAVSVSWQRRRA